jgi:uncharacterized membrane protein YhaH (DUF805 family)
VIHIKLIKNLINNFINDWTVFDGKIDRKSFLINFSLNLILQIIISLMILSSFFGSSGIIKLILGFIAILIYGCLQINFYSLIVRRLHDNNKSGWCVLLFFLSIVFLIGMRQSKSSEEYNIFTLLLISNSSLFLYFLLSSDKKQKSPKKNRVTNASLTTKPRLFKNYKIFIVPFLIIGTIVLFVFKPYKTNYYQCDWIDGTSSVSDAYVRQRTLIVNKYLLNSYSMTITGIGGRQAIFKKSLCKTNKSTVGFVCKYEPPREDIESLYNALEIADAKNDEDTAQKLADKIRALPQIINVFYRFDPISGILRHSILFKSSEKFTQIHQCIQTENKL